MSMFFILKQVTPKALDLIQKNPTCTRFVFDDDFSMKEKGGGSRWLTHLTGFVLFLFIIFFFIKQLTREPTNLFYGSLLMLTIAFGGIFLAFAYGYYSDEIRSSFEERKKKKTIPKDLTKELLLYPQSTNIDQAWHGIHYLLTGTAEGGVPPLSLSVLGGQKIGEDIGYGPALYLTPTQVSEVALALSGISIETFAARFDSKKMTEENIHLFPMEDVDYFIKYFKDLVHEYKDAAKRGNGMLTGIF